MVSFIPACRRFTCVQVKPARSRDATRLLFGLAIACTCVGLVAVAAVLDLGTAVKAAYTTLGLLLALALVELGRRGESDGSSGGLLPRRWAIKGVVAVAAISVAWLQVFEVAWPVLVGPIPLGYVLLYLQFAEMDGVDGALLAQLGLLFAVTSHVKLASTHFYHGYQDLIVHSAWTEGLVETGELDHLSSFYDTFPGLHVSSGSLSVVSGLAVNDAILVLGLCSFVALLATIYAFLDRFTGLRSVAFLAVLFLSVSEGFVFYSNYFFPQSLGLTFVFVILFVATSEGDDVARPTYVPWAIVTVAVLLTHHFTFVLMLPIVGVLLAYEAWLRLDRPDPLDRSDLGDCNETEAALQLDRLPRSRVHPTLVVTPFVLAVSKWMVFDREFLRGLLGLSSRIASSLPGRGTGADASASTFYLGLPPVDRVTVGNAVEWLAGVDGVYATVLVALFATGLAALAVERRPRHPTVPLAIVALCGSVLVFETPVSIATGHRLALPFAVFVLFVGAYGVHWATGDASGRRVVPVAVLVFLFAASGPVIAMHDVENHTAVRESSGEYTPAEYEQLQSTVEFVDLHQATSVASFRTERNMFQYLHPDMTIPVHDYDGTRLSTDIRVANETLVSPEPILYNEDWSNHRLTYAHDDTPYDHSVLVSRSWLEEFQASGNHTYDAGTIGIVEN